MKIASVILIAFLSTSALAGELTVGTFSSNSHTTGNTTVSGVATSSEQGVGKITLDIDGTSTRTEKYTRDDSTVTTFRGRGSSNTYSTTTGSVSGLVGISSTETNSQSRESTRQRTSVDNNIEGTYVVISDGGKEKGTFSETYSANATGQYQTHGNSESESTTAYTNY